MTGPKTATVEALTAEVRVLMVGSRQVTLSVVRQLDEVEPDEIEPFGRVRAARQPQANLIEVVGSAGGILAYSTATIVNYACSPNQAGNRCNDHTNAVLGAGLPEVSMRSLGGDRWIWWEEGRATRSIDCNLDWRLHSWRLYVPDKELYQEWQELPLIVLAGLR